MCGCVSSSSTQSPKAKESSKTQGKANNAQTAEKNNVDGIQFEQLPYLQDALRDVLDASPAHMKLFEQWWKVVRKFCDAEEPLEATIDGDGSGVELSSCVARGHLKSIVPELLRLLPEAYPLPPAPGDKQKPFKRKPELLTDASHQVAPPEGIMEWVSDTRESNRGNERRAETEPTDTNIVPTVRASARGKARAKSKTRDRPREKEVHEHASSPEFSVHEHASLPELSVQEAPLESKGVIKTHRPKHPQDAMQPQGVVFNEAVDGSGLLDLLAGGDSMLGQGDAISPDMERMLQESTATVGITKIEETSGDDGGDLRHVPQSTVPRKVEKLTIEKAAARWVKELEHSGNELSSKHAVVWLRLNDIAHPDEQIADIGVRLRAPAGKRASFTMLDSYSEISTFLEEISIVGESGWYVRSVGSSFFDHGPSAIFNIAHNAANSYEELFRQAVPPQLIKSAKRLGNERGVETSIQVDMTWGVICFAVRFELVANIWDKDIHQMGSELGIGPNLIFDALMIERVLQVLRKMDGKVQATAIDCRGDKLARVTVSLWP